MIPRVRGDFAAVIQLFQLARRQAGNAKILLVGGAVRAASATSLELTFEAIDL